LHENKTFCPSSPTLKNLRASLDRQKQSFLFSGDSTWLPREKGSLGDHSDQSEWSPISPVSIMEISNFLTFETVQRTSGSDYSNGTSPVVIFVGAICFLDFFKRKLKII